MGLLRSLSKGIGLRAICQAIVWRFSGVPATRQELINFLIHPSEIHEYYFRLSRSDVTNNLCFRLDIFQISENLLLEQQTTHRLQIKLSVVGTYEFDVKVSDIIAPTTIDLTELFQSLPDSRNISIHSEFRLLTSPKIFFHEKTNIAQPRVSENLLEKLKLDKIEGKQFANAFKQRSQETSASQQSQPKPNLPKIRKSSSQADTMTNWDLLHPLLCPPLSLEFPNQLDFYQPLRNYQQPGVEFMVNHSSALLADEMGTGKTVQAVNALRILFRQSKITSALVVCPANAIGSARLSLETRKSEGWDGHFYQWDEDLLVTVVRDSPEQRKIDWERPAHIYITTYETLRDDLKNGILQLSDPTRFDCVVIDEAQKIKSRDSGMSKAVRELQPKYRWALTGTPIENSTKDVITIFDFVKPGLFQASMNYSPQEIKKLIEPYMLRRLKKRVLKDLPDKNRQEKPLDLDSKQKSEYEAALAQGRRELSAYADTESDAQLRLHIFALLHKLKKICNFAEGQDSSPKSELFLEYVTQIIENNEKVLVFSQYKSKGITQLGKILKCHHIKFTEYHGELSKTQKEQAIADFRNQSDIHVFLGTFKSAGTAITLTEASHVIHFDHWWNPATMQQAEDRAHRIGQTKTLNVYSFWTNDTIEEGIRKKLREKRLLVETVIDPLAVDAFEQYVETSVTNDEWLEILGVQAATRKVKTARTQASRPHVSSQTSTVTTDKQTIPETDYLNEPDNCQIDFAIITAIEVERVAVCRAFQLGEEHREIRGQRTYWRNRIFLRQGGFYEIVVAQLPDASNIHAALRTSDIIRDWKPTAIFMVGIAGAARSEQLLGDVIIAKDVYYYERGKETPSGHLPEPTIYKTDSVLWDRIIATPDWKDLIPIPRPDDTEKRPAIHRDGVIASGEKVIADPALRDEIASVHRKILAIEMEGYGVGAAVWDSPEQIRWLVIRALCDRADSAKNDNWHAYAAAVAAGYTRHFLFDRPLEPRNSSKSMPNEL